MCATGKRVYTAARDFELTDVLLIRRMARSAESAKLTVANAQSSVNHGQVSKGLRRSYAPQETRADRAIKISTFQVSSGIILDVNNRDLRTSIDMRHPSRELIPGCILFPSTECL